MAQPAYISISARKWKQLNALIPSEWRLPDEYISRGMTHSPIDSVHKLNIFENDTGAILDIPSKCGILSTKEAEITEKWDVRGLLNEIAEKRLNSEEVVLAFCKVYEIPWPFFTSLFVLSFWS
jgi:hypothetical protein